MNQLSEKRFKIIHLGNPYDFVVKDFQTNRTYGTSEDDKNSLEYLLNRLDFEIEVKQKYIEKLEKQLEQIPKNIRKVWLED